MTRALQTDEQLVQIGERIRRWRDRAGFTLQEVADRSGVAASTVHKIERTQTVATISVLLKIVRALNRRPDELLMDEAPHINSAFQRKADRMLFGTSDKTQIEQLAIPIENAVIDLWRMIHQPGEGSGTKSSRLSYDGEVICFCISGEITFELGEDTFVLHEGDSIHYKGSIPHCWMNTGDGPAIMNVYGTMPENLRGGLAQRVADLQSKKTEASLSGRISNDSES